MHNCWLCKQAVRVVTIDFNEMNLCAVNERTDGREKKKNYRLKKRTRTGDSQSKYWIINESGEDIQGDLEREGKAITDDSLILHRNWLYFTHKVSWGEIHLSLITPVEHCTYLGGHFVACTLQFAEETLIHMAASTDIYTQLPPLWWP